MCGISCKENEMECLDINKKQKKIALFSVFDVFNYGSMLQSYALQRVLFNKVYYAPIINYNKKEIISQVLRIFNKNLLEAKINSIFRELYKYVDRDFYLFDVSRKKTFSRFVHDYLSLSERISTRERLLEYVSECDFALVGSDQVWNPISLGKDYYTLNIVPEYIPKISYASSFGVSSISGEAAIKTSSFLKRFDFISVREKQGIDIVSNLTNKTAKQVLDPTFLLEKNEWLDLVGEQPLISGNYIFCYYLGNRRIERIFAENLKKKTNCKIVNIPHSDGINSYDFNFGDYIVPNLGPLQFLNLIYHAQYICTDSFHCSAFSIIFHKSLFPFYRFDPQSIKKSTNGRIESLLDTLKIERRLVTSKENLDYLLKDTLDYDIIQSEINILRKESMNFLYSSLL